MLRSLFIVLLLCSSGLGARMYQWVDPESGSTQLSGKPPMWYRSGEQGPRVFVFERSKIIDDTGIDVSESEREELRQRAFLQADEDRQRARDKLLQAKRMDAALEQKQALKTKDAEENMPVEEEVVEDIPDEEVTPPPPTDAPSIEQMRKLIAEWEKATTEKARGVLDTPPAAPK